VDAGLYRLGHPELVAGQNATLQPVRVPLESGRVGLPPAVLEEVPPPAAPAAPRRASPPPRTPAPAPRQPAAGPASEQLSLASARPAPLPYLDLDAARGLPAPELPAPRPLGPVARHAAEAVLREAPPRTAPLLRAQALPEDLGADTPEDAGLGRLVSEHLLTGDLPAAEKRLQAFLAARRTEAVSARARFYLGQVYYLQGKLDRAVLELLLARPRYYPAVQPWLENCLQRLSSTPVAGMAR
jgi:hypothetical protein